ncbi:MAG TPA: hypothetical protein VMG32_05225 [Anaeromyxobacteraceae bacterium]|nr:hypothetical protein [Anaeromyxobacteraceae bacterium]
MSEPVPLPFTLPPLEEVLGQSRAAALAALGRAGWRPYATPIGLDAERRRVLNIDLTEPEVAWQDGDELVAVAHLEADRAGRVTLLELSGAAPVRPETLARALLPSPGEPRLSGGEDARVWVWGPETGGAGLVQGEPVRLWACAERAYGDRLWATVSLVLKG